MSGDGTIDSRTIRGIDTIRFSPDGSKMAFIEHRKTRCRGITITGIYVSNVDGSRRHKLSGATFKADGHKVKYMGGLSWTKDGSRVTFVGDRGGGVSSDKLIPLSMYSIGVSDSKSRKLFDFPAGLEAPHGYDFRHFDGIIPSVAWSQSGQQISFLHRENVNPQWAYRDLKLYTINADGTEIHEIANLGSVPSTESIQGMSWSFDDSQILFSLVNPVYAPGQHSSGPIYIAESDGSGHSIVAGGAYVAWSPDGSRIASVDPHEREAVLRTMAMDGSDVRVLAKMEHGEVGTAVGPDEWRKPVDTAACSAGVAVPQRGSPLLIEDCRTLLALRDRLAGSAMLNWDTDTPMSRWAGVILNSGRTPGTGSDSSTDVPPNWHVGELQLAGRGLKGIILPEIANLTMLRKLDLSDNELSGTIPPVYANLVGLEVLRLGGNQLTGSIPPELGNLGSLTTLDLRVNSLSGPIPPELGSLGNLIALDLGVNRLSGPIPPELGALLNLELLDIEFNDLSGPFPPELRNLTALRELAIRRNDDLTGCVPPELQRRHPGPRRPEMRESVLHTVLPDCER